MQSHHKQMQRHHNTCNATTNTCNAPTKPCQADEEYSAQGLFQWKVNSRFVNVVNRLCIKTMYYSYFRQAVYNLSTYSVYNLSTFDNLYLA